MPSCVKSLLEFIQFDWFCADYSATAAGECAEHPTLVICQWRLFCARLRSSLSSVQFGPHRLVTRTHLTLYPFAQQRG